jgi:T5SS/PEP-CTERM-associated repeat protein
MGSNWSPQGQGEPTVTDFVFFNNGGISTVTHAGETCKELRIGIGYTESGTLNVTGGELTTATGIPGEWYPGNIYVGNGGTGTINISGGGTVNAGRATFLGYLSEGTGYVTVSGTGSTYAAGPPNGDGWLYIGFLGHGAVEISNGGTLTTTHLYTRIGDQIGGSGTLTIEDSGSIATLQGLYIGREGAGTVNVTNSGTLLSTSTISVGLATGSSGIVNISNDGLLKAYDLFISADANPNSVVKVDIGGMLALHGDGSASITAFMNLMPNSLWDPWYSVSRTNSENIDYWNGTAWDDLDNATPGSDVDLTYYTSGDLSGYTVLTVLEVCGSWGFFDADLNKDCYVDIVDFALFATEWLKWVECTDSAREYCMPVP